MKTFAAIALAIATVANAAPVEQPVSPVIYGVPPTQSAPLAIASDGRNFAVLWRVSLETFASIVDASGRPIAQVRIASTPLDRVNVCWSGDAYVVVWSASGLLNVETISSTGSVLVPAHTTGIAASAPLSVASNGSTVLVAFANDAAAIHGVVLDRGGIVVRPDVTIPSLEDLYTPVVTVATNGDGYAIVWTTDKRVGPVGPPPQVTLQTTLHAARLTASGDVVDAQPTQFGPFGYIGSLTAVFVHGRYVIAANGTALHRFLIDPATMSTTELPLSNSVDYGAQLLVNGDQLIAYELSGYPDALFIAANADSAAAPLVLAQLAATAHAALLASNGSSLLFVWLAEGGIKAATLDRTFNAGASYVISTAPRQQQSPRIAAGSDQSLIAWIEQPVTNAGAQLRAVRVSSSGAILDREPIVIASNVGQYSSFSAVAVAGGYFIAWQGIGIQGRRFERDGSLGPTFTYEPLVASDPALAATADAMLLVYRSYIPNDVRAIRLTLSGQPVDAMPFLITTDTPGTSAQVATNGSDFLVVWARVNYDHPSMDRDVLGVRVSATGAVDAAPIAIATGPADQLAPNVASDGRDYLVIYASGYPTATLASKRVLREGQLADSTSTDLGTPIATTFPDSEPSIVAVPGGYFVSWETDSKAFVQHVDSRGTPSGTAQLIASRTPSMQPSLPLTPVIATAAGQPLMAAYARAIDDGHSPIVTRVFLRLPVTVSRPRTVK